MRRLARFSTAAIGSLLFLSACSVERQQQGEVPDVDVDVDPGRWPDYDVNWADVDVGTEQRTITVPVVRVDQEQREVTVPFIRITPPNGGQGEEHTVSMAVDVPDAGYELRIVEVRAAADNLWVVGELHDTGDPATQVVTRVQDQVVIHAPDDLDIRKVVVGQRPSGVANQEYRFFESMAAVNQRVPANARVIYRRPDAQS